MIRARTATLRLYAHRCYEPLSLRDASLVDIVLSSPHRPHDIWAAVCQVKSMSLDITPQSYIMTYRVR
jgi:hypothetical protein